MRSILKYSSSSLLAVVLAVPLLVAGCATRVRYYDAGYGDYHTWNSGEAVYYNNWEHETHREHREFRERNEGEQKEYWAWRHNHH
jgi:hypothetical protein